MISKLGYQPVVPMARKQAITAPKFGGEVKETKPVETAAPEAADQKAAKKAAGTVQKSMGFFTAGVSGAAAVGGLTEMGTPDWPAYILLPFYVVSVMVPVYAGRAVGRLLGRKIEEKQGE